MILNLLRLCRIGGETEGKYLLFGLVLVLVGLWNVFLPKSARKTFQSWNKKDVHNDEKDYKMQMPIGIGFVALGLLILFL